MSESKQFHISDVLSITSSRLVSSRHMDGIYDILGFMTGEQLYTHQLPRAMREAQPWLLSQHPQLVGVGDDADITPETCAQWVSEQVEKFGEYLTVQKMPAGENGPRNPIQELVEMVGKDRVICIAAPESHS